MKVLDSKEIPHMSEELSIQIGSRQLDKFERFVSLRMMGHSLADCARLMNVSRVTLHQWTKLPLVIAMVARERSDYRAAIGNGIIAGALAGIKLMENIVNDFRLPVHQRMEAGRYLIELHDRFTKTETPNVIEDQLAKVLVPEVVADEPEAIKALPAPTDATEEKQ
jgi:hypothetical protein